MSTPALPRLWFTSEDILAARRRVQDGEPTSADVYRLASELADTDVAQFTVTDADGRESIEDEHHRHLQSYAIAYVVTGEATYARRAYDYLRTYAWEQQDNLGRGSQSLMTALAMECCWEGWSESQRLEITHRLVELHNSFYHIGQGGDPHHVVNNHWAVNHAAAAIAAMAVHGLPRDTQGNTWDLTEEIRWARCRVRPFLGHHGDAGLYHEGLGYMVYPSCFWLPMVLASRNFDGTDLVSEYPNLASFAPSLYSVATTRPTVSDSSKPSEGHGMMLSWNDAGLGWSMANAQLLAIGIAPPALRGALRWMYDRLNGHLGGRNYAVRWGGWIFSLLCYPYEVEPEHPQGVLPLKVLDSRQGLAFFRNRYRDGEDTVLGTYARTTFVGGHRQDDAGSVRLAALGHDWIIGGGQARPAAEYQSVLMPADGSRASDPLGKGAVMYYDADCGGGVIGLDLRNVNVGYCERWLAIDFAAPGSVESLVAMMDLVDDHAGRDWVWNLSHVRHLEMTRHEDGRGFDLDAPDGAWMRVKLLGAVPRLLELRTMPGSERTFQNGQRFEYPGQPYVHAEFGHTPHLNVLAAMAIGRGDKPQVSSAGGVDVQVGDYLWRRPFGAAVPADYPLGEGGTMSRWPAGKVRPQG
ncbi:MAG: hypothetical protein ACLFV7_08390 [Phycisphaerae bacterium]